MTEEEKKAIYSFNEWIEISEKGRLDYFQIIDKDIEDMKTVLNLIQNLQEENKKYKYLYLKALEQKDKEIEELKKEYYCLINRIEDRIDKFDYEFNKAKRKNDNDRADYYWDLIINFKKLLESE